jgi:flagellar basal-body rod protein FlgG
MVRGMYTGASAMAARVHQMDVVSNNLANVNTTSYKRDVSAFKAFPEMIIRRQNDDGVRKFPLGSWDKKPVVGKLGTGVELNEVYTNRSQGTLRKTENNFDFGISGKGYFVLKTDKGVRYTRNGSFTVDPSGILVNKEGFPVLGENGIIEIKRNNFAVRKNGEIYINKSFNRPAERPVQMAENGFEDSVKLDTLKVVDFPLDRYIKKVGTSMYAETETSGSPVSVNEKTSVLQGFLENSNVNVVTEMVHMIEVQRSYEAAQKTISSHDSALDKLINYMATA